MRLVQTKKFKTMQKKIFIAVLEVLPLFLIPLFIIYLLFQQFGVINIENIKVEIHKIIFLSFLMGILSGICLIFAIIIIVAIFKKKSDIEKSDIEIDQIGQ